MELYDLRTEYKKDPIGITEKHPRFSWKMETDVKDTFQKSYHIVVKDGENIVWETKEESEESVLIPYAGEELKDETLYFVAVEVTDNHGNTAAGEMSFETGIMDPGKFKAKMITHDFPEEETACPIFSKSFSARGTVKKARIYVRNTGMDARARYLRRQSGRICGDPYRIRGREPTDRLYGRDLEGTHRTGAVQRDLYGGDDRLDC